MQKNIEGIFLTELNLLKFITNIFFHKKKYCVLDTYSYIFNHGSFLLKIVNKLHSKNLVLTIKDKSSELPYIDTGDCKRLTDVFAISEKWMNSNFNMNVKGFYSNAIRHIISNRTYNLYERCIDSYYLSKTVSIQRLNRLYKSFFLFRYNIEKKSNHYEFITKYFTNFLLLIFSWLYFLSWVCTHIRIFYKRERFRFAVDYVGGSRDIKFWDYLNPEKEKTLVVVRDKFTKKEFAKYIDKYKVVYDDDGVFSFYLALKYCFIFFLDSIKLYVKHINIPPDYFRQICFLPYKKIKYEAFFNKYRCDFFWGRDDYNYQHIIRSQVLRKNKGISMGCNHGIESINSLSHILRQIDYDYYYCHGTYQYFETYKKFWPKNMIVKGVGSFFSSPDQHKKITNTKGKNMAIIIAPSFHQEIIFNTISIIADEFPEITIWISTKPKHRTESGIFSLKYQKLINSKQNIKESKEDVYDLLSDCKYVFSESSTLLAESVYFKKVSLCFDPEPKKFKFLYYRNFPELIFNDVESIVSRIKKTQSINENFYKDKNLDQLICKTETHPWDIIKNDIESIEKS